MAREIGESCNTFQLKIHNYFYNLRIYLKVVRGIVYRIIYLKINWQAKIRNILRVMI